MARAAVVIGGDTVGEPEKPGTQRSRVVIVGKVPMDFQEYLLHQILAIGRAHSQPAERRPHVVEVLVGIVR
jgi:hypothetical protein